MEELKAWVLRRGSTGFIYNFLLIIKKPCTMCSFCNLAELLSDHKIGALYGIHGFWFGFFFVLKVAHLLTFVDWKLNPGYYV